MDKTHRPAAPAKDSRWCRGTVRSWQRFGSNDLPTPAIFSAEEVFGLGSVADTQRLGIPFETFAGAVGDVAEVVGLGQQATVAEMARRRRTRLTSVQPFRMVAERVGNGRGWRLEIGELFFRQ